MNILIPVALLLGVGVVKGQALKDKAMSGLNEPEYTVTGPLVSVVIPTLQEEDYIEELLISVRNQTYRPIEIIISDSSPIDSKEMTRLIANRYGARMVDAPKKNVALGRNEGARAASGEILLFMDADCIMAPDFTERLVGHLQDGVRLAHGNDYVYDSVIDNAIKTPWNILLKPDHFTTGRGVAIRADDFWTIGGYSEDCDPMLGCREDLDLSRKARLQFGEESVELDRNAVVATCGRRPWSKPSRGQVWVERGWRKGVIIERAYQGR